ncbi:apolipophorins [Diorhabda sublineata]|uniref:apolipophorins n=1 Tax=Diorhabda sublineata TaxID=1163346 RepID=UPI0024E04920|nr:apolipophorins [Diorhabda sublineata]
MGRRGPFRLGLALAVFLVAQQTFADQVCRTGCKGNNQVFKYTPGTTYKYNYEGKIDISLSSAEGQITSTDVKATVLLTQLGDCNQLLRLQNVQILTGNKKHGTVPDLEKPVQINFHDGHIEDSICTDAHDTQNSLNIKRAIASLFQANLNSAHETDVFGLCPTEIAQHKQGADLVVVKSRDLNKCAYREHLKADFFATTFDLNSEIKSSPLLNGDYTAKLTIKNGILNQVLVTENYFFVPFSVGKNGAKAVVTTKLHLMTTLKESPKAVTNTPRSIIFDNPHPVTAPTCNVNTITNAVKEVAKSIDVVVGEKTAKEFVTLIKTIRVANKNDLLAVYNQVRSGVLPGDKATSKKLFLDALLQAGTGDAIEAAITLLKSNEFNEGEKSLVYLGMSLVKHSTENAIKTAAELLDLPNLPEEAYLGIGNVVGSYCRAHSCKNVDAINQITQKLLQKLAATTSDKKVENQIILILKTLANFKHLNDNVVAKITSIAENRQASTRLRAFALDTYLSDPCKDKIRNSALQILKNIQQDSEIRIRAYLVLAQCPNDKIGNAVKALLEQEPSYQVGGFITSHIRNLRASANPDKQLAKQYLGFSVTKKFPIDFRKWSYNGELSYAVDTLGMAASSDVNIIYSENDFLPRLTTLNATAEVFGHSMNFLELNLRQENLNRLVEHYFGPNGLIRGSSLGELFKNEIKTSSKLWQDLNSKLKSSLRARRDVSRKEIDNIGRAVQIKENELDKDLDLDISVKAFGSELLYTNLNAHHIGLTPEAIIDQVINNFNEGLDKLKSFQDTFRANILFLDSELDYPTSLGFPLRLAAEGTANTQLKAEGGIDVRALLNNKDTNVNVKLIPSAKIEITARLSLDALVVENGIKLVSSLYTATGCDVKISYSNNGKGVDVKLGLPVQEQKLISLNHQIVSETREQAGQTSVTTLKFSQPKDFNLCLDQASAFIGLAFCVDLNGPNLAGQQTTVLPFPLSGDAKFAISIENEDLKEYHFKNIVNQDFTSGEILVECVGKNGEKKVSFQFLSEIYPQKFIKAIFNSPVKSAFAEGRITNTNQEKSLLLKAGQDNTEAYIKLGVGISGSQDKSVYNPILEFKTPDGNQQLPVKVDGKIIAEKTGENNKYTFENVKIHLPNQKILGINGNIGNDKKTFFSDLTFSEGQQSVSLTGRFFVDPNQVNVNAEVKNNINQAFNFHINGGVKKSNDLTHIDSNWQLIHGQDLSSKTNTITLISSVTRRYNTPDDFTFGFKNKFSYPLLNLNIQFDAEQQPKSLQYDVDFHYNDIKFGSELDFEINKKTLGDFDVDFDIYSFENKVGFKSSREVLAGEQSKISNELDLNGVKLEVKGIITHNIKATNVNLGADLTVILPTHPTPFKVDSGLQCTPSELSAHHKVVSGNVVVIDAFLNANKNGNANGSVKVNIKNMLVVNGQLKSVKGKGTADLQIDANTPKKSVKLESTFEVQPPTTYNVVLTLYPSFDKDKNQKIIVSTNTKISSSNIDSKNKVDILGKVLQVNVNGICNGEFQNGKQNGEIEIILPTDQYLLGKFNRNFNTNGDVSHGQDQASLEYRKNKNSPGRKISVSSKYNNINHKEGTYDVSYEASADDANGRNINGELIFKVQKQGEKRLIDSTGKIYGSVLKDPIQSGLKFNYIHESGDFELSSSYGTALSGKVGGKYDIRGEGIPISGELEVQFISAIIDLKSVKSKISGSVLLPREPRQELKLTGAISALAENNKDAVIADFSADGQLRASDKDGEIKGTFKSSDKPISVVGGYSRKDLEGDKCQLNGNVGVQYGAGKNVKFEGALNRLAKNQYKLDAQLETPYENFKTNKLVVETKQSEDLKHIQSNVKLNLDGKVWTQDTELKYNELSPLIDVKLKDPEGKISQVYLKGNKISVKEFGGEWKVECQKSNFLFEGNFDTNLENMDNFYVRGNINSPNLKLNKIQFDANNKGGKANKKIQINIKSAGKNVVSGSTTYQARDEHGKYIIEGSGTLKIKEQSQAANFKYISQPLTFEKNGEEGFEIDFDAGIGNNAIDAELKITDKQFRILESYCEKNKECAHFELDSKISENDINKFNHVLEITVDLRKLGVPNEFGLKAVTTRNNYVFDQLVDIHFQRSADGKYSYNVYLHPEEAGISLTTPKRIISLEGHVKGLQDVKHTGGKVSAEAAFYLDKKNQPNKKAALSGWVNVDPKSKGIVSGDVRLTHPELKKPFSISLNTVRGNQSPIPDVTVTLAFDIFRDTAQKLVAEYKFSMKKDGPTGYLSKSTTSVKSNGLGIDILFTQDVQLDKKTYSGHYIDRLTYNVKGSKYDNLFSIKGSKKDAELILRYMNIDLIKIENKMNINRDQQIIDSEISSYDNKPVLVHLEIKKFNTLLCTIGYKNDPKTKLQFNSGFIPGQIADVRSDLITSGGKANLFHVTVKLDDANFLKPDYNVNSKAIESTLTHAKENVGTFVKGLENIGKEISNDYVKEGNKFSEMFKTAVPDVLPVLQYYDSELQKIQNELDQDKSLEEFRKVLKIVYVNFFEVLSEVLTTVVDIIKSIEVAVERITTALIDSFDNYIVVALRDLLEKLLGIFGEILNMLIDIVSAYLALVSEVIEKYQPEIKQLAVTVSELGQDVGRFIQKSYVQVRKIISDLYKRISDELKALPIVEELRAEWEDFVKNGIPNADGLVGGIKEIAATIKDLVPPEIFIAPEINEIVDLTVSYLEKKIKQEPVDDFAVFDKIITANINLIKKVLFLLTDTTSDIRQPQITLSLDIFNKLPKLVAVKFSPIAYILQEDPSKEIVTFLLSLFNNPTQWIPPFQLFAMTIEGQYIFTFDGKYYNFPANCKYLLARDAFNGNFTIIGTYSNGHLTAISLADQHDSVTVNENGQVTLNNAHVELPIRKSGLSVYRDYYMVYLTSKSGVTVACTPTLRGCGYFISGFYHGQIKGLLGKGNNEPYDDFTAANGKIVTSESDFGNSYKIGNCKPVVVPAAGPVNAECTKLFDWESPMRLCYPFVDTETFKAACTAGLASNTPNILQSVAASYVASCLRHNIFVSVPPNLLKCTNGQTPRSVGDKFSVKVPTNAADIVLLVDTVKQNQVVYNELIKPLIQEVIKELATKGITDVDIHLITYGGENHSPSHVTVGGKLTYKGKLPDLKFVDPPKNDFNVAGLTKTVEALHSILKDVELALGQDLQARTYTEGYKYPFRAHAAKTIIAVTGKPCEVGKLYPLQKLRTLLFKNNQISIHLFTPFENFHVKDQKKTSDVIGFNSEHVFTFSQGKKKPDGSSELYKDLQYDDYCVDFTVKNRGNVFVSNNFLDAKADQRKHFAHVAAYNVVDTIANYQEGLDCECRVVSPMSAKNICSESYVPKKN